MKRIIISILLILLSGCSMKDEKAPIKPAVKEYPTSTFISDEIRKNSELNALIRCTLSRDEKDLKKAATDIAIINVISIDYSDMNLLMLHQLLTENFLLIKQFMEL